MRRFLYVRLRHMNDFAVIVLTGADPESARRPGPGRQPLRRYLLDTSVPEHFQQTEEAAESNRNPRVFLFL